MALLWTYRYLGTRSGLRLRLTGQHWCLLDEHAVATDHAAPWEAGTAHSTQERCVQVTGFSYPECMPECLDHLRNAGRYGERPLA